MSSAISSSSDQSSIEPDRWSVLIRNVSLVCLAIQNVSSVLLLHYVESEHSKPGSTRFSSAVANVCSEIIKFVVCMSGALLFFDKKTQENVQEEEKKVEIEMSNVDDDENEVKFSKRSSWSFRVRSILFARDAYKMIFIAVIYSVENNLYYVALRNVPATFFQVLYQLKLIITALMLRVLLDKRLSAQRWAALVVVFIGIVISEKSTSSASSSSSSSTESQNQTHPLQQIHQQSSQQNMTTGVLAVLACAFCSAFASAYFESVLKLGSSEGGEKSLLVRNAQLAMFSIASNLLLFSSSALESEQQENANSSSTKNPFAGFDKFVWLVVLVQAIGGLLVSLCLKYADAISKSLATGSAIALNGMLSMMLFGFHPTLLYVIGATIVIGGVVGYARLS
jgi:UDP-sugar transporter A1/2/3